jgi:putative spermidine/putrescine transport system permease protein
MAATASPAAAREAPTARPVQRSRSRSWAWLGVVPFFLFAIAFLFLPITFLVVGSFTSQGELTLQNYADLQTRSIVTAFQNGLYLSAVTAILGGVIGFLLASAVILGGLPRFLRTALMTFSGVASNFAGVPLALAFVFTLGNQGLITLWLWNTFGFSLADAGFRITSMLGLILVYMYFQFPLMVLIIAPAIDGLRKDWREAAENMGATPRQYWRYVALPILLPSILGTIILLFGNAFGAQATAFQLTGGTIGLVPVQIGAQIRGDVLYNPGLGYAMAMGMVFIMGISILIYTRLQRRSERWLRS